MKTVSDAWESLGEKEFHKNKRDGCWHWASTRVDAGERDLSSPTLMAEVFVTGRFRHDFSQSFSSAWCPLVTPPGFCVNHIKRRGVLDNTRQGNRGQESSVDWGQRWAGNQINPKALLGASLNHLPSHRTLSPTHSSMVPFLSCPHLHQESQKSSHALFIHTQPT